MSVSKVKTEIKALTRTGLVTAKRFERVSAAVGKFQDGGERYALGQLLLSMNSGVLNFTQDGMDAVRAQYDKGNQVQQALEEFRKKPGSAAKMLSRIKNWGWGVATGAAGVSYGLARVGFTPVSWAVKIAVGAALGVSAIGGLVAGTIANFKLEKAEEEFLSSLPD